VEELDDDPELGAGLEAAEASGLPLYSEQSSIKYAGLHVVRLFQRRWNRC
jgi:hypothetical protein